MHAHLPKLSTLLSGLSEKIALQPKIVIIESNLQVSDKQDWSQNWISWTSFVDQGISANLGRDDTGEVKWRRQSFDWPLWILFSSGTTGLRASSSQALMVTLNSAWDYTRTTEVSGDETPPP